MQRHGISHAQLTVRYGFKVYMPISWLSGGYNQKSLVDPPGGIHICQHHRCLHVPLVSPWWFQASIDPPPPNSGTISTSSIRESSGWWQTQITHLAKEIWVIYTKSQTWFGAISYSLMYGCPIWIRTLWLCHVFPIPISGKSHLSSLSLAIT